MKNLIKRYKILCVIFIILTLSITNIQASKKDMIPQNMLVAKENILANMTVIWDSFFHNFSFDDLQPQVTINQSPIRDFYFPEINGTIQMNFTVVCKHRLENRVLLPRFTRVYLAVSYNNSYIFLRESSNQRCKNLFWNYINLTVNPNNQLAPLITNGENKTLTVEVRAYGFPFGFQGIALVLNSITVHPIPMPP